MKKILFLLNKKEKNYLIIISLFLLIGVFVEMISFAIIIPVFNIIFLNSLSDNIFFRLFFDNKDFLITKQFKIIILVILLIIFFVKNIYLIILNFYSKKFFYFLNIRLSTDLFSLYLKQNYYFFLNNKSDNLLRKSTNDIVGLQNFITTLQSLIIELIFIFFLSILLFTSNYKIFLFFTFIFATTLILYIKIIKERIKSWSYSYQANLGHVQNLVVEGIRGIKDLMIYNLERFFSKKFFVFTKDAQLSFFKVDFINNIQRFWMEILAVFSITIPIIFFIFFDDDINQLIPIFVLFSVSIFRVVPSFNRIIQNYQNMKFYKPSVDIIYNEFLQLKTNPNIKTEKKIIFKEIIELKNVNFSYNKGTSQILSGINIKILKGESVAILGDNGSGKTTLLNTFSGLLEPSSGKVIVDGQYDIYKSNELWLNNLSYVQQNIFLINTTIKKNILLEKEVLSDSKKFLDICNVLLLDKAFANLPNKLDTIVGNDGLYLSGGQKQLISIARALYKDSDVILFDEANSALDKDYSDILKKLIISLRGKKTLIVVTHELSYLKECFDKIYRIKSGSLYLE
jgi:ABC-type multidrug transport system fused ATPase/permease subunit